jgi:cobalamin synthase
MDDSSKRICPTCGTEIPVIPVDCPRCARIKKASDSLWLIPLVGAFVGIVPWVIIGPWGLVAWIIAVAIAWAAAVRQWMRLKGTTPRHEWSYSDESFPDGK